MLRWVWRNLRIVLPLFALLLATLLTVAACNRVELAARAMVTAPNHGHSIDLNSTTETSRLRQSGVSQELHVPVGPPSATLCAWIVEPPESWRGPPRATILYLHGIFDRKESLLRTARSHAARGYRGVLVDSRGHGASSGDWMTYGAQEVRDYRMLIDALQQRGLVAGRLGIYGCSYGAGVAVQLAGMDDRVATAVVLAPFTSMRQIVRDRARSLGLTWLFSAADIDAAIARGCGLAGIRADEADGLAALQFHPVPLLVIHGRCDSTIPCEHGAKICASAAPGSKLLIVEGATHDDWTKPGLATLWSESTAWFDRWLTADGP